MNLFTEKGESHRGVSSPMEWPRGNSGPPLGIPVRDGEIGCT